MPITEPTATCSHEPTLDIYYRPEMAVDNDPVGNYSRSPSKPRRFMEYLSKTTLVPFIEVRDFAPLSREDFVLAHTPDYVDAFFAGRSPLSRSNGLTWSSEFADTVRYTNGSLVAAVDAALGNPARVALSPTSGFHHARPSGGAGFCTFSGQVIAAVRAWRERGARGAWIDLDGHFGNSIEDSREYVAELAFAIPLGCNLNPEGRGRDYLAELERGLADIGARVLAGELDYVAFAHGADSHVDDDLYGQCDTHEWLVASHMVYGAVRAWSRALGRPVPLVLALFGGYRADSSDSVLELHASDCAIALRVLSGADVWHTPRVVRKGVVSWMDLATRIPAHIPEQVRTKRLLEVGFDADSGSSGGHVHHFDPAAPLEEGLVVLEKYGRTMNAGHLRFDDRTSIRLTRGGGFERYDAEPQAAIGTR